MSLETRIALSLLRRGTAHSFGPDPSQVADLHLPRGPGPHPVAVVLHGGHWQTRYGRLVTRPLALDLAGRGWAAWNLEYRRLGSGRGGGGGWPMTFDDVAAGIDALAGVDAALDLSRVLLVGHSAGGQLALWAASRPRLPAGAVGSAPVVAASAVVGLAPVTDLQRARVHAEQLLGGAASRVPERWAQADPVRAGAPGVPALIVHPTGDTTVPIERSREYAARSGVELVETPGVHRDPIDPGSAAWVAAVQWLEVLRSR
ncbi:MAG: alpha/beta hydrolase [Mycobacteriales bacterium]